MLISANTQKFYLNDSNVHIDGSVSFFPLLSNQGDTLLLILHTPAALLQPCLHLVHQAHLFLCGHLPLFLNLLVCEGEYYRDGGHWETSSPGAAVSAFPSTYSPAPPSLAPLCSLLHCCDHFSTTIIFLCCSINKMPPLLSLDPLFAHLTQFQDLSL